MSYTYTLKTVIGDWEVHIDPKKEYGYFEDIKDGGEGGLWFDGKALKDYDGFYELPQEVIQGLRNLGFVVGTDFE